MIKGLYEAHLPVTNLSKSVDFYEKLGLKLAYKNERLAFFWIDKGVSWLGLWQAQDQANVPYHPSLRHIAFHVEQEDIAKAKEWLKERGISVRDAFGFSSEEQPLVLSNNAAHGAIYFNDPDGNSLEFITPLQLDMEEEFDMVKLDEWYNQFQER